MALYDLSGEGAAALKMLSGSLISQMDDMLDAGSRLEKQILSLENELGSYGQEIKDIISHNRELLRKNYDTVIDLTGRISAKSDQIEQLVRKGIVPAGIKGGSGTSGTGIEGSVASHQLSAQELDKLLEPGRKTPRELAESRFGYTEDREGNLVYDSPMEMDNYLYREQGKANPFYQGTCGICSCANILRLAGVNTTEAEALSYASHTKDPDTGKPLCVRNTWNVGDNGATSAKDRQLILKHFGIDSVQLDIKIDANGENSPDNIDQIAKMVSNGNGVIISVHSDMLWYNKPYGRKYHAVTVTSVKKDKSGKVLGFYICDTGKGGTEYYTAEKIRSVLTGNPMNITSTRIR